MNVVNINPEKEPIPAAWVPRVIQGGKEPPDGLDENWLERLPVGTVFVCSSGGQFGTRYELIWKGSIYYLLYQCEFDKEFEAYVDPLQFCKFNPVYEILGYETPTQGDEHEQQDGHRTD